MSENQASQFSNYLGLHPFSAVEPSQALIDYLNHPMNADGTATNLFLIREAFLAVSLRASQYNQENRPTGQFHCDSKASENLATN